MSEPKKYQADTPVTLQLLADVLKGLLPSTAAIIEDMIEPTKPQPRDGELWLVQDRAGDILAQWSFGGDWYRDKKSNGAYCIVSWRGDLSPIKLLLPAEGES